MGNTDSRLDFRKGVVDLVSNNVGDVGPDNAFWQQFWQPKAVKQIQDVFSLITSQEIRQLRENAPQNLATLCYKAIEQLCKACQCGLHDYNEQQEVLNCVRILTRLLPFMFEESEWRNYFWSPMPAAADPSIIIPVDQMLGAALVNALCSLLFCPDFTVALVKKGPEVPLEDLNHVDSCEYIWEAGIGFAASPAHSPVFAERRTELLRLLLTCISEAMYCSQSELGAAENPWLSVLSSSSNRHVLPLFTSLINVVFSYDPIGYGVPYNHLLFADSQGVLVDLALQLLIVVLDQGTADSVSVVDDDEALNHENYFVNYLSRIHREEDFEFMLKGFSRLLNNPLMQTYLPNSCKKINFHQELLILFWKCCDCNKKFLFHVLKSSDVLDILVPVLYYLNQSRNDASKTGLAHMGVFIILLLSGERNFGVRLNKPYLPRVTMDIPLFTGSHADLLIIVFHKLITSGHGRLQSLFDCLLTVVVNISPYLKSVSMVAANKLLHLLEVFSTPWYLFAAPNNHHLVFFLLEIFNNIIQYQFDGNANLVYTIIRKRQVFYQLANLSTDDSAISSAMVGKRKATTLDKVVAVDDNGGDVAEEDAAKPCLEASLAQTPKMSVKTEKTSFVADDGGGGSSVVGAFVRSASLDAVSTSAADSWIPSAHWVESWKQKLPLQTIMRLLQVLVPQVEKICIDRMLTDEGEVLKFLQNGTLVGLLPVPHPILIRKYQKNRGTNDWFRTYMWGVIYLRNTDPPIWYDTRIRLFEIQKI